MDELEFRRRAIAHPQEQDPAFLEQAQRSPPTASIWTR